MSFTSRAAAIALFATLACASTLAAASSCVFSVADFGAKCDNATLDTAAILAAVAAAKRTPASSCVNRTRTVLFPAAHRGTICVSAPIDFGPNASDLTVYFQRGAALRIPATRSMHKDVNHQYAPLLFCRGCTNFRVGGDTVGEESADPLSLRPTVFASGPLWWPAKPSGMLPDPAPVPPYTLQCLECTDFELFALRFYDCAFTCIAATNGARNHLHHLYLYTSDISAPNIAGIYADGLTDSTVADSTLAVTDDCITAMAWTAPARNMTFERLTMIGGQGLSFGSMIFHGLTHITYRNIVMKGSTTGIRIKAQRVGNVPNTLSHVTYENIELRSVGIMISVELDFKHTGVVSATPPQVNNVTLRNVTGWGDLASMISCLPESPCTGWRFDNVFAGYSSEVVLPYYCNAHFVDATLRNEPPSAAGWPSVEHCPGLNVLE